MDARREQLRAILRRRRRIRLLVLCVGTALVCGLAAAMVTPEVLIGGEPHPARPAAEAAPASPSQAAGPLLLGLTSAVRPDPREEEASARRWAALDAEGRQRYLHAYWDLAQMDPTEREGLLEQYRAFRSLPEERQAELREQWARLAGFLKELGPQDLAPLAAMGPEQRAERLVELWKKRNR